MLKMLGIAGSLREKSFNRALLRACVPLMPGGWELEIYERLGEIPPYNEDLRTNGNPAVVADLKERVRRADALLIVTPEYNYGVPGVLKNAIDWVSRPDGDTPTPLKGKWCAIAGAAPSNFGTVRAQLSLRQSLLFTETKVVLKPEVHVFGAEHRFDKDLNLTDETTKGFLRGLLGTLAERVSASLAAAR